MSQYKSLRVVNGRLMWRKQNSRKLTCEDCGGDRSVGSASFCRKCYRARAANKIPQNAPALLDQERPLPPVPRPKSISLDDEPINVTALLSGKYLR